MTIGLNIADDESRDMSEILDDMEKSSDSECESHDSKDSGRVMAHVMRKQITRNIRLSYNNEKRKTVSDGLAVLDIQKSL